MKSRKLLVPVKQWSMHPTGGVRDRGSASLSDEFLVWNFSTKKPAGSITSAEFVTQFLSFDLEHGEKPIFAGCGSKITSITCGQSIHDFFLDVSVKFLGKDT